MHAGSFTALLLSLSLVGCQRAPRPLVAGTDACDYCRMTVSDTRFGGEIQSETGRIHTFDSLECLASFYVDASARNEIRAAWVTDFESGRFLVADSAVFIVDGRLSSPMGRSLIALAPGTPDESRAGYGGKVLRWPDLLELMRTKTLQPGATPDTAPHGAGAR
jgi:copper chaperone NosL